MRKLGLWLVCAVMTIAFSSEAQFNRKQIKRNNKKISRYRGHKQHFGKEKIYNAVGISVNATNYYGDLAPKPTSYSTDIAFTRPGFGVFFNHRFGPRYTLMSQFMVSTIRGGDSKSADPENSKYSSRYLRNLEFKNNIKELKVVGVFDLFANNATYISRVKWTPYVFGGVSLFLSTPKAKAPATDLNNNPLPEAGEWVKLRPLGTEGQYADLLPTDVNYGIKPYSPIQFSIPFGIGLRLRINEVLDFWADVSYRYTFTDYLDDVSGNYVDLGVFGDNELARAMSYRTDELPPSKLTKQHILYTGRDGKQYFVHPGYGQEHPDNLRGSSNDRDIILVTSLRISYIIGATFHKAKFR